MSEPLYTQSELDAAVAQAREETWEKVVGITKKVKTQELSEYYPGNHIEGGSRTAYKFQQDAIKLFEAACSEDCGK